MAEIINSNDALYAFKIVEKICREAGPGLPGSPEERERASIIKEELELHLGTGNVAIEEFTLAPRAFLGSLPVCAVLMFISALLNISAARFEGIWPVITSAIAFIFSVMAALVFIMEFFLYREFIDPFFKKKKSVNIIGTLRRPGTQKARRLLIISGHHDSAWENNMIKILRYGLYITTPTIFIAIIVLLVMGAILLTGIITANVDIVSSGTLGWGMLIFPVLPAVVFAMLFSKGDKTGGTVPGAVDNLSASALSVAICRFLVNNPSYIPDDMEIRFISFGSEEAGLRGSRRYVERHQEELKRMDVRVLNFEMVAHPEITILTTDVSGTVKNSPAIVQSAAAAADRAGVPYKIKPYPIGGGASDAGPFTKAGLKALTLLPFKMPQQLIAFYHQKKDGPNVLTTEPLLNVLKLTFEWIRYGGE